MPAPVSLRPLEDDDLPVFFAHQREPAGQHMVAFTTPWVVLTDFIASWQRFRAAPSILQRVILADGAVAGYVCKFEREGVPEVCYWLGQDHWGRRIATRALTLFLGELETRPLHARVAKDNLASLCVLERNGFVIVGDDRSFADGRGEAVEEWTLLLRG